MQVQSDGKTIWLACEVCSTVVIEYDDTWADLDDMVAEAGEHGRDHEPEPEWP